MLASTEHDAAVGFSTIMLWFVLPLVAMTIVAVTSYDLGVIRGKKDQKDLLFQVPKTFQNSLGLYPSISKTTFTRHAISSR